MAAMQHAEQVVEERKKKKEKVESRSKEDEERIEARLVRMRIDHEARRRLAIEVSRQKPLQLPEIGWHAGEFVDEDEGMPIPVIEHLHYEGNNTLLVAEFKTGKTTMEISLAAALVDEEPFLGKYETNFQGNIAFLNYEMDRRQFRKWLSESEIEHIDRIIPLNLRGWHLPFWNDLQMLVLAEWLDENDVKLIIMDPAARAWRGLVDDENDNTKVSEFFGAIDELKRLSDCPNLILAVHTPRAGADRARGSGEIEAWPDANWYLGKVKGIKERSFRAEGRDVLVEEMLLGFNEDMRTLHVVEDTPTQIKGRKKMQEVVDIVEQHGIVEGVGALASLLKGNNDEKRARIKMAVDEGLIVMRPDEESNKKIFEIKQP
jgi:hypothetical protein